MALHHASPGEVVDLGLTENSSAEDSAQPGTRAIVKTDRFEAIRLVLRRGESIPSHEVASEITIHCLDGAVSVSLADQRLALRAGQWVYFDENSVHGINAEADAVLLMTIMLPIAG